MVVAAHPLASAAGAAMLNRGGNAIDAAVAASFVISVVRPQSTGLGGGGFMLYHDQARKRQRIFDFRERAPLKANAKMFINDRGDYKTVFFNGQQVKDPAIVGHLSVAVPGLVKGLVEIHRELGKLKLSEVIAPAIDVASKGFPVYPSLAKEIKEREQWLRLYPGSRQVFFKDGKPLEAGQKLVQSDLAETLKLIAATGYRDFYEGETSKKIVSEIKKGGGVLDTTDLRSYRMIERVPVSSYYRGHRVISMPPPSSGGVHIIEMLNMLEQKDLSKLHPRGATYLHYLAEVMRRAFADRAKEMGDPDFVDIPTHRLTSKAYAKNLAASIDPQKVTPSSTMGLSAPTGESPSTSHISVMDQWGNAVATTQTVNYSFGSCVVAEGTGVVLNDEMDDFTTKPGGSNAFGLVTGPKNDIAPGKTPLSSMSPTMILDKKGQVELVAGSPGGPRIINAVLQTITNVIDFKMSLLDAVHATRIHHQWMPDTLRYENNALDDDTKKRLTAIGHLLTPIETVGDVQAISRDSSGMIHGVSDIRSDGKPVAP
jgi:gamma-glutamyltranspeptidase/glutathione hydrolase